VQEVKDAVFGARPDARPASDALGEVYVRMLKARLMAAALFGVG